jgi:hypothetical protein
MRTRSRTPFSSRLLTLAAGVLALGLIVGCPGGARATQRVHPARERPEAKPGRPVKHRAARKHARARHERSAGGASATAAPRHRPRTRAQGEFERMTGYAEGRPGYTIEYIKPLSRGGVDDPGNMRWRKTGGAGSRTRATR